MKYLVASNVDSKLNFYGQPMFVNQSEEDFVEATIRGLKTVSDPKIISNCVGKELHILGTFDDNTGKFDLLDHSKCVVVYNEYLKVVSSDHTEGA